jgi:hypothetical protein
MRTLLIIALGTLAAFGASLVGTYFALPLVAPDVVEAHRAAADSLAADGIVAAPSALVDSLGMPIGVGADSSAALGASGLGTDSTAAARALSDSLVVLRQKVAEYEARLASPPAPVAPAPRLAVDELAATIVKIEDRELRQVLDRLDLDVLETLYAESSGRNRARLLGALDPARAAVFIQRATSASTPAERAPASAPPSADGAGATDLPR